MTVYDSVSFSNAIPLIARLFVALNGREKKFVTRKLDEMRTALKSCKSIILHGNIIDRRRKDCKKEIRY